MSNPVEVSLSFLYGTLSGDATFTGYLTGGVWVALAPAGTLPDFCTITPMSSKTVLSANGFKVMTQGLYQVRISGPEADASNIEAAYDRMLTDIGLVRSTSGILACYQEQDVYIQELVAGVPWINWGGLFRVEV